MAIPPRAVLRSTRTGAEDVDESHTPVKGGLSIVAYTQMLSDEQMRRARDGTLGTAPHSGVADPTPDIGPWDGHFPDPPRRSRECIAAAS